MIPTVDDQVTPQIAKKEAQRKRAQQAAQAAEVQKRREGGNLPKDLFAAPTRAVSKLACYLGGLICPKISPPDHVSLLLVKSCLPLILYSHTRIWGLGLDLIGQTTQKIKGSHKTYCFHLQLL